MERDPFATNGAMWPISNSVDHNPLQEEPKEPRNPKAWLFGDQYMPRSLSISNLYLRDCGIFENEMRLLNLFCCDTSVEIKELTADEKRQLKNQQVLKALQEKERKHRRK
jgi:hypothetical protein